MALLGGRLDETAQVAGRHHVVARGPVRAGQEATVEARLPDPGRELSLQQTRAIHGAILRG